MVTEAIAYKINKINVHFPNPRTREYGNYDTKGRNENWYENDK